MRNRGIGRLLLETLLEYATEQRFARVVLNPTQRAAPFYRRAGVGPADMLLAKVINGDSRHT